LKHAHGRVLNLLVESETYPITPDGLRADFARRDVVPYLDVVATVNQPARQAALFVLNRDLESKRQLTMEWRGLTPTRVLDCQTLTGSDLKAVNTFEQPKRVAPQALEPPKPGAHMSFEFPARSYSVVRLALG
jgi:alpha-N-arabinofuranosidase